jgi:hypothetical protein
MMSKYSPDEARALYEELVENTDIVGHAACGNPFEELSFRFEDRTMAVAEDYTVDQDPIGDTEDGPPRLRFHVASPWHALIHLSVNNRGWLEGKQGPLRTPLIFRGQRDSRWAVVPSLLRKDTDPLREARRLRGFCTLVREALASERASSVLAALCGSGGLSDTALEATAQHYGIRTKLLDFTSDPAVAVWFACQGGTAGESASVFALPMAVGALFEFGVVLCHPLALRPYRQHGLFIWDSIRYLKRLLIEVRFPIDTAFRIKRDRLPTALLPEDEWWTAVVAASEVADHESRSPRCAAHPAAESVDESLLHMMQMLMELTTFDVARDTAFNHEVITQIARSNGELIRACVPRCGLVATEHFRGTTGQFVVPRLLKHLVEAV